MARGKGWYRTNIMADLDFMEVLSKPIIPDGYQTPDETEHEKALIWIIEKELTKEERNLLYARYYDRLSIRQICAKFGHNTHGHTQGKLKKLIKRLEELLAERGFTENNL